MAQGKIIVETAQLDAASAKVGELAGTYKGEYEKLYKLVEELQASWAGADNTAYTTQIEGFRDDFEKMYTLMTDYSDFLKTTAKRYRDTQDVGVGIIMGKSTKEDVEAYFGKPLYEKDTENGMVIQYAYKNVYLNFNFYKDTGKIRVILIDGVKGLDDV